MNKMKKTMIIINVLVSLRHAKDIENESNRYSKRKM
jgi:hypothetical protein